MQAARSPPVQAVMQPGGAEGSMLQHLRLLQLLVQHSASWQAMQLLLQSGGGNCLLRRAPDALQLEQSLSSDDMAATACQPVGDASSQCCEPRFGAKRARHGSGRVEGEDEEVVSSAAAPPHARGQRAKRARGAIRAH